MYKPELYLTYYTRLVNVITNQLTYYLILALFFLLCPIQTIKPNRVKIIAPTIISSNKNQLVAKPIRAKIILMFIILK